MKLLLYSLLLVPVLVSAYPSEIDSTPAAPDESTNNQDELPFVGQNATFDSMQSVQGNNQSSPLLEETQAKAADAPLTALEICEAELKSAEEDASIKKTVIDLVEEGLDWKEEKAIGAAREYEEKTERWLNLNSLAEKKEGDWGYASRRMEHVPHDLKMTERDLLFAETHVANLNESAQFWEDVIYRRSENREKLKTADLLWAENYDKRDQIMAALRIVAGNFSEDILSLWSAEAALIRLKQAYASSMSKCAFAAGRVAWAEQYWRNYSHVAAKAKEGQFAEHKAKYFQAKAEWNSIDEHYVGIIGKVHTSDEEAFMKMGEFVDQLPNATSLRDDLLLKRNGLIDQIAGYTRTIEAGPPAESIEPRRIADKAKLEREKAKEINNRIRDAIENAKKALPTLQSAYAEARAKIESLEESCQRIEDASKELDEYGFCKALGPD